MIDFEALVLAPCMTTFAVGIKVYRVMTAPGSPAYSARGIYSSAPIDIEMQDGAVFSDQQTSLGITMSEFAQGIGRGDRVKFDADAPPHLASRVMWVADVDTDGQGGGTLLLRATKPEGDL